MNKILFLGLLIVCHGIPAAGQIIDPDPNWWFSFYPLEVGNTWQYDVIDAPSGRELTEKPLKRVLGDSLFSNGFRYFKVEYGQGNLMRTRQVVQWERVDSTEMMVMTFNEERASYFGLPNKEIPLWPLPNGELTRTYWFSIASGQHYSQIRCRWAAFGRNIFGVEYPVWSCDEPWQWRVDMAPTLGVIRYDILYEPVKYESLRFVSLPSGQQGIAVGKEAEWDRPKRVPLSLFPNPASAGQSITLQGIDLSPGIQVQLVDVLGRRWTLQADASGGLVRIDLPLTLKGGLYHVLISSREAQYSAPFVIQ